MKKFWHMQMYPTNEPAFFDQYGRIILEHFKVIGLGNWEEKTGQISDFNTKMQIGDIVAIKKGQKLIALVEVTSLPYQVSLPQENPLCWLEYRRNIKVLDWADDLTLPATRGTLKRCVDEDKDTTQIIKGWYDNFYHALKHLGMAI